MSGALFALGKLSDREREVWSRIQAAKASGANAEKLEELGQAAGELREQRRELELRIYRDSCLRDGKPPR